MSDYPVIFSAPMVRALLDGKKTMTRRIPTPTWRKVAAGDRLWVREAFQIPALCDIQYRATATERIGHWNPALGPWRPSIHMRREFSRLTLAVTATKVERLQDISEEDAVAEGCRSFGPIPGGDHDVPTGGAADAFKILWESLHGAGSWEKNPELVALTFTVHKVNIDQMAKEAA